MSGTSADGVDAALVRIEGVGSAMTPHFVGAAQVGFEPGLRRGIQEIRRSGQAGFGALARMGRQIADAYVSAVVAVCAEHGVEPAELACVSAHGQTLYHAPPDTIQWLDPAILAHALGCPIVSDLRRADLAAGGQGAPLVPFGDYILFRSAERARAIVNIGGIGNVTILPAGATLEQVRAFDTGPGNCISDHLCQLSDPAGPGYDAGGQIAAGGTVDDGLVEAVLDDDYFAMAPPKSTDGPAMIAIFEREQSHLERQLSLADQLATACAIAARSIVQQTRRFGAVEPADWILAGGGTANPVLMNLLRREIGADATVLTTDALGIPTTAREAVAFALIGCATLDGQPGNVPAATGASGPVILGSVTRMR